MKSILKINALIFLLATLSGCVSMINSKVFSASDTNNDGYLSYEEFSADEPDKEYAKREFGKADTNNDNRVSKAEMKIYIESTM